MDPLWVTCAPSAVSKCSSMSQNLPACSISDDLLILVVFELLMLAVSVKSSPRILKAIFLQSLLRKSLWKLCGFVTSEVWWPQNGRSHKQAWNPVFFCFFFTKQTQFFHPSSATYIAVDYIFCWIYISQWLQWIAEKLMGITRQTARLCSSGLSHRFSKTKQQCFTALY